METKKFGTKIKYFSSVTHALAINGASTRKSLASSVSVSPSTLSKALEVLLDLGIIREKSGKSGAVFSLTDELFIPIIDLSSREFTLSICRLDTTPVSVHTMAPDGRYFFDECISLFLRECSLYLARHLISHIGICIIAPDANDALSRSYPREKLTSLACSYFNCDELYILERDECISYSLRCITSEPSALALYTKGERLYAMYRSSDIITDAALMRDINTSAVVRAQSTTPKTVAATIGNTVALFVIRRIILDTSGALGGYMFEEKFNNALSVFLQSTMHGNNEIHTSSHNLALCGISGFAREKYVKDRLKSQEGHVFYEHLSN